VLLSTSPTILFSEKTNILFASLIISGISEDIRIIDFFFFARSHINLVKYPFVPTSIPVVGSSNINGNVALTLKCNITDKISVYEKYYC